MNGGGGKANNQSHYDGTYHGRYTKEWDNGELELHPDCVGAPGRHKGPIFIKTSKRKRLLNTNLKASKSLLNNRKGVSYTGNSSKESMKSQINFYKRFYMVGIQGTGWKSEQWASRGRQETEKEEADK